MGGERVAIVGIGQTKHVATNESSIAGVVNPRGPHQVASSSGPVSAR